MLRSLLDAPGGAIIAVFAPPGGTLSGSTSRGTEACAVPDALLATRSDAELNFTMPHESAGAGLVPCIPASGSCPGSCDR